MALSVAPAENADSYVSLADAQTYHDNHGTATAWAAVGDNTAKEAALRIATEYIDGQFGRRFLGERTDPAQWLAWPRQYVFMYGSTESLDDELVPKALKDATAWLALESKTTSLTTNVGAAVKREKVGPLETEYAVSSGSSSVQLAAFPYIRALLGDYMAPSMQLKARRG